MPFFYCSRWKPNAAVYRKSLRARTTLTTTRNYHRKSYTGQLISLRCMTTWLHNYKSAGQQSYNHAREYYGYYSVVYITTALTTSRLMRHMWTSEMSTTLITMRDYCTHRTGLTTDSYYLGTKQLNYKLRIANITSGYMCRCTAKFTEKHYSTTIW